MAIAIFAVVTYVLTQSLWTTVINTVICAVLIQIGYVIAVLWMVARAKSAEKTANPPDRSATPALDPTASKDANHIGGVPKSGHL